MKNIFEENIDSSRAFDNVTYYTSIALLVCSQIIIICTAFDAEDHISRGNSHTTPFLICFGLIGMWFALFCIYKCIKNK